MHNGLGRKLTICGIWKKQKVSFAKTTEIINIFLTQYCCKLCSFWNAAL